MLHAMPGVAATAADHRHVVSRQPAKVVAAAAHCSRLSQQATANSSSSTSTSRHSQRQHHAPAAASGSGDSCGTHSSSSSRGHKEQLSWQPLQPSVIGSGPKSGIPPAANGNSRPRPLGGNGSARLSNSGGGASQDARHASSSRSQQVRSAVLGEQQLSGAAIMQQLKAATRWQQLQQLVQQHGAELNWRHSSALVTHLAQLSQLHHVLQQLPLPVPAQEQQQQQQQQSQQEQVPWQEQQGTGQVIQQQQRQQDPGSAGAPPSSSSNGRGGMSSASEAAALQAFVQTSVMPLMDSHMQACDARGLANCLWAVAKLRAATRPSAAWLQHFCSVSQPLLQHCDAQQLSNTLWGLVQLQHTPPQAWMQSWYPAILQACAAEDSSWRPQSVSSALWSLATLYGGSSGGSGGSSSSSQASSRAGPSHEWVDQLLTAAVQRVVASAHNSSSSSSSGASRGREWLSSSGQVVSNLLWACVQLQQQPSTQVLTAVRSWLQHAAAAKAAAGAAGGQQQLLGEQALANCMWALGKLHQQQQQQGTCHTGSSGSDSKKCVRLLHKCGGLVLRLAEAQLPTMSRQHLVLLIWGAGALGLELQPPAAAAVTQQLADCTSSFNEQQVANLLWGLSKVKQPQQGQQPGSDLQQQQPEQLAQSIELLLAAQAGRLAAFSSQALGSSLLSLARMHFIPSDLTLHSWLAALTHRPMTQHSDLVAVADACCALALLRQQQHAEAADSSWQRSVSSAAGHFSSSGRSSSSSSAWQLQQRVLHSSADGQWLQEVCALTEGRLGVLAAGQLCGLARAFSVLRFRAPVPWLTAWQSAVADKAAGSISGALAARMLFMMHSLPGIAAVGAAAQQSTHLRVAQAAVASAAAAAAAGKGEARNVAGAATCVAVACNSSSSSFAGSSASSSMEQLMQVVPSVLHSCSTRHLSKLLLATAAVGTPLPAGLLSDVLQQAAQQRAPLPHRVKLLAAVAKAVGQQRQHLESQQQLQHEQQVLLGWLQQWVPQLQLQHASAADLAMSLWPQAVLCFHPGHSWLAAWEQHSVRLLQQMTSSELASCGWALSVLRYRPQPQWLAAWSQAVAQHIGGAALVPPHVLSLLLYSSATLSCPVNTAWLKAAGQAAARQAGSWAAADVADGFWGLGQLGLRAAAAEEVLEVLVSRLVAATAPAMDLQQLGPHRQLQVLQAAVLLGGGLSDLQEQQQQQRPQRQQWRQQRRRRQAKLRWLNFRAWRASLVARQAAAVAAAAAAQAGNGTNPGSSTSSSSSLASRDALARIVGKAAVVSRKYVKLRTGKDPAEAAAAGLLRPAWFVHWCRCSLGQLHSWGPQQVAAAFGAFAAMQWQPPPAWQQQMLAHVMQPGGMSVRTATALQDALVALQSPFVTSWRAPLAVTYMPGAPQQRQQGQQGQQGQQYSQESSQQHSQQQQQLMTRPGRRRELSHPHHLRGGAMRHLRRRHHLMRLVGWWRQQQLLQQQYAVQRQQQQEDMEAEWRAAAAAAGLGGFGTSGFDNSGYTSSSSAGSSGYSSDANSAGDTSSASTSSASSGSSVTRGVLSAVPAGLQPRRLESTSLGHQLQRPTMRPAAAAVASAGAPVEAAAPADVTHAATGAGSSGGSTRDGASPAAGSGLTAAGLDTIGSSSSSSRPFDGGQAVAGSAAAAPDTSSNNGISTGSSNTPNAGPVIGNSAVPGPAGVVQVVRADSAAVMPASAAAAWCNWATVGPAGQMDTGASDTAAAGVLGPLLQSGGGPVWKQ